MDRAREKKNIQRTKKGEKSHQNKFFIAKCAIEKKHVWIRFFFLLLQSNKVWSCESHIARACGDSHKKILFSSYFLCVYSVHCTVCTAAFSAIYLFLASFGCWSNIGYHTHLYAIKLSITSVNIEIILCLVFERREK